MPKQKCRPPKFCMGPMTRFMSVSLYLQGHLFLLPLQMGTAVFWSCYALRRIVVSQLKWKMSAHMRQREREDWLQTWSDSLFPHNPSSQRPCLQHLRSEVTALQKMRSPHLLCWASALLGDEPTNNATKASWFKKSSVSEFAHKSMDCVLSFQRGDLRVLFLLLNERKKRKEHNRTRILWKRNLSAVKEILWETAEGRNCRWGGAGWKGTCKHWGIYTTFTTNMDWNTDILFFFNSYVTRKQEVLCDFFFVSFLPSWHRWGIWKCHWSKSGGWKCTTSQWSNMRSFTCELKSGHTVACRCDMTWNLAVVLTFIIHKLIWKLVKKKLSGMGILPWKGRLRAGDA